MEMFTAIRSSTLGLGIFAVVTAGLIAVTQVSTNDRIADNERKAKAKALYEIVDKNSIDNDLLEGAFDLVAPTVTGFSEPVKAYRATKDGKVVAVILPATAPDGYSGNIGLIVGISAVGETLGVRVLSHKETPGLGDKVELSKSDWVLSFNGLAMDSSNDKRWAVKKDGGQFDQFTGATITPRAVVNATARALRYFHSHRDLLLDMNRREVASNGN